jgi:hypothetical protein
MVVNLQSIQENDLTVGYKRPLVGISNVALAKVLRDKSTFHRAVCSLGEPGHDRGVGIT